MIDSMLATTYWARCDMCESSHQLEETWLEADLAEQAAMDAGWTHDPVRSDVHYCPDCSARRAQA